MGEFKLTYKDFEIGQTLICVKLNACGYFGGEPENERLILDGKYVISDIDFHFPDRVCVKLIGPYYRHHEFVPIECFIGLAELRDYKIDKILSS